jgi:hypothetical protein
VLRRRAALSDKLQLADSLTSDVAEALEYLQLGVDEEDEALIEEVAQKVPTL